MDLRLIRDIVFDETFNTEHDFCFTDSHTLCYSDKEENKRLCVHHHFHAEYQSLVNNTKEG